MLVKVSMMMVFTNYHISRVFSFIVVVTLYLADIYYSSRNSKFIINNGYNVLYLSHANMLIQVIIYMIMANYKQCGG